MNAAEDTLDRMIARYQGQDLFGGKVSDLLALKALIVELREGSTPPSFDLVAHNSVPSRANPLAAAFAVNSRSAL